jgi:hypothetical protein
MTTDAVSVLGCADVYAIINQFLGHKSRRRLAWSCRTFRELKVHCLHINVVDINKLEDMTKTALVYKVSFNFSACRDYLTDVSMLRYMENLNLSACSYVTDVSALKDIKILCLEGCSGITDVSMLTGVQSLYMNGCINLTKVGNLSNVKIIDISNCHKVTDISGLDGIYSLAIRGCSGITDISMLLNVKALDMRGCHQLGDIREFRKIREDKGCFTAYY